MIGELAERHVHVVIADITESLRVQLGHWEDPIIPDADYYDTVGDVIEAFGDLQPDEGLTTSYALRAVRSESFRRLAWMRRRNSRWRRPILVTSTAGGIRRAHLHDHTDHDVAAVRSARPQAQRRAPASRSG